jgi:hypothetical protein
MRLHVPLLALLLLPLRSAAGQAPAASAPVPARKPPARKPTQFLQVRDQQLLLGQSPFRNVGATIPDLLTRFLRGDDAGATSALSDARAAGVRFVRCAGLPPAVEVARTFAGDQARWFAAWDRMLTAAAEHEIALVPSLLYDPHTLPQVAAGSGGAAQPTDLLDAGTPANRLAVAYVTAIVTRYKNDPRILFWEIGNEFNLLADLASANATPVAGAPSVSDRVRAFLEQMAALIHRLDRRHRVTSGNGDLPSYAAHLPHRWPNNRYPAVTSFSTEQDRFEQYQQMLDFFNPPGIDIVSVHAYPPLTDKVHWLVEDDVSALRISWTQLACTNLGKPLFVGAFGQPTLVNGAPQPTPWMLDFLRRLQAEGAPLSAVQSWEPGADDPTAGATAVSPAHTPQLAFAVRVVNTVIDNAQTNNLTLPTGPPLDLSPEAMQADRQRTLLQLLRAISAAAFTP